MTANIRQRPRQCRPVPPRMAGFSMIEVLIALIVLAFGLLGFALLQTMNLRFTQSANYKTEATNLAYDLLDQMRANRYDASRYAGAAGADFAAGTVVADGCSRPIGLAADMAATIAANIDRWQCQVVEALGPTASAGVVYLNGNVRVVIAWGDQRWDQVTPDATTSFTLQTRL